MLRTASLLAGIAFAAWAPGCGPGPSPEPEVPAPTYPEGTVLAVGGHPITAADVERYVDAVAIIEPEFVERDHRRKVLTNIVLPTAAGAALDPGAREVAFQEAQRLLSAARETGEVPEDAPEPMVLTGTFREVGLAPWALATTMEPMTFSQLQETPGAWTFFKLIATAAPPGEYGARTEVTIVRYDVPYIPREGAQELLRQALDELTIEVVDPDWEALVPPIHLYGYDAER
ncbi:MAG: hypothetical protein AAGA20_13305 [Planctomycetota bacterium]